MTDEPNPFAAPMVAATQAIPDAESIEEVPPFVIGKSIGKWLLVCSLSAAPSFVLARILDGDLVVSSAAMILGILTFVAVFVFLESRERTRNLLLDRTMRTAVRTGYISRMILSIVFPIAMMVDLWCGVIATTLVNAVLGFGGPMGQRDEVGVAGLMLGQEFAWYYITTLVQGVILNLVLTAYALLVYGVMLVIKRLSSSKLE